ncbi:MAG: RagB/SusD family nutrient uptake outer membrane protein, partial [Cyclobacteriaceae bacterium]
GRRAPKNRCARWDQEAMDRYENATVRSSEVQDPITGEVKPYIDVYKGSGYENPVFEDNKHYHWPLPLNVLTQNPELKQNPGWEF